MKVYVICPYDSAPEGVFSTKELAIQHQKSRIVPDLDLANKASHSFLRSEGRYMTIDEARELHWRNLLDEIMEYEVDAVPQQAVV